MDRLAVHRLLIIYIFRQEQSNFIPIENDIQQMKNDFGKIIQENEFITTAFINDGLRRIIFIESFHQALLEKSFRKILRIMKSLILNRTRTNDEFTL